MLESKASGIVHSKEFPGMEAEWFTPKFGDITDDCHDCHDGERENDSTGRASMRCGSNSCDATKPMSQTESHMHASGPSVVNALLPCSICSIVARLEYTSAISGAYSDENTLCFHLLPESLSHTLFSQDFRAIANEVDLP